MDFQKNLLHCDKKSTQMVSAVMVTGCIFQKNKGLFKVDLHNLIW